MFKARCTDRTPVKSRLGPAPIEPRKSSRRSRLAVFQHTGWSRTRHISVPVSLVKIGYLWRLRRAANVRYAVWGGGEVFGTGLGRVNKV